MTAVSASPRSQSPVFVLGSPRSGTTLLYDMLLSAGRFAVYLAESNVFNVLALRFGGLGAARNREKLLSAWLGSKLFRATGLEANEISRKVRESCHSSGDFLRLVMSEMARQQGMPRWAENSREAILHLPVIKQSSPDALIVHIIRDGRDVAMSLGGVRYVRPFPWEERPSLGASGIYWEWIVQHGRRYGRMLGHNYLEIRFEDLLSSPQETLDQVGRFIDQKLDYERILQVAYGSVAKPNTTFTGDARGLAFNPVGRWKTGFPPDQLLRLERMVGRTLRELRYVLSTGKADQAITLKDFATKASYRAYFEAKLWVKKNSVIRTFRPGLTAAEMDATMLAEDHPPEVRSALEELPD